MIKEKILFVRLVIYCKDYIDDDFQECDVIDFPIKKGYFSNLDEVRKAIGFKLSNIICNNIDLYFMFKTYVAKRKITILNKEVS